MPEVAAYRGRQAGASEPAVSPAVRRNVGLRAGVSWPPAFSFKSGCLFPYTHPPPLFSSPSRFYGPIVVVVVVVLVVVAIYSPRPRLVVCIIIVVRVHEFRLVQVVVVVLVVRRAIVFRIVSPRYDLRRRNGGKWGWWTEEGIGTRCTVNGNARRAENEEENRLWNRIEEERLYPPRVTNYTYERVIKKKRKKRVNSSYGFFVGGWIPYYRVTRCARDAVTVVERPTTRVARAALDSARNLAFERLQTPSSLEEAARTALLPRFVAYLLGCVRPTRGTEGTSRRYGSTVRRRHGAGKSGVIPEGGQAAG
ncbi:uncharacterized protein LOC143259560 [Megalopta genalis]|uniref:uncharacterized protein LOC143259560 n=1 Tax=Megalopta genalis TaxID=115081 RepID=UPI003FD2BDF3